MTSSSFLSFKSLTQKHSLPEALRANELEETSVRETLALIKAQDWTDAIDLVEGSNVHLFSTDEEKIKLMSEIEAAEEAGVDSSDVEWISAETACQVSCLPKHTMSRPFSVSLEKVEDDRSKCLIIGIILISPG